MNLKGFFYRDRVLTLAFIFIILIGITIANAVAGSNVIRFLDLCGIYVILSLSMVMFNGFTGQFSLGHAGFIGIGAYTSTLLTLSSSWAFLPSMLMGGVVAAMAGLIIGGLVLRLKGNYTPILTLCFAEFIRNIMDHMAGITNGVAGVKAISASSLDTGVPPLRNPFFTLSLSVIIWITAIITVLYMVRLVKGRKGKIFLAIREDEMVAETLGIKVFQNKLLAFIISCFFAGLGGALLGGLMQGMEPKMFGISLTLNIALMVLIGGNRSITGGILGAVMVTSLMNVLLFLELPFILEARKAIGWSDLSVIILSLLLVFLIIIRPQGIMGKREFTWLWFINIIIRVKSYYKNISKKVEKGCDE